MRAAAYIRLSVETEATTSPERQRAICAAYAASRGWDLVAVHEDIDVSATRSGLDRPGLAALRADVAAGRLDVVVIWRLDRLARSVLQTLTLITEWEARGVALASATEPVDLTTPVGRAMAALIAIFAEMEADTIRARARSSIDALVRAHRWPGGRTPYGYRSAPRTDGPGRRLELHPGEADVLREAADRILAGAAPWAVCQDLNRRRVPAPHSPARLRLGEDGADPGAWYVTTLRRLLLAPATLGHVVHRGDVLRGPDGLPMAAWPPALSPATARAVRERLAPPGRVAPRRVRRGRLLSGLARCAECGRKLYVLATRDRPVYHCAASRQGLECAGVSIAAPALEQLVTRAVLAQCGAAAMTRTVPAEPHTDTAALADVEAAIRQTTEGLAEDAANVPALTARLAALKDTRRDLRAGPQTAPLYVVEDTGSTWAQTWAGAEMAERQAMLEDVVRAVEVARSSVKGPRADLSRVRIEWCLAL